MVSAVIDKKQRRIPMISEERKRELNEKTKNLKFPIPPEVSCRKETLSDGQAVYVFRHEDMGDFGRMLILPNAGESQFVFEVIGDEDNLMLEKKKAILDPIAKDIVSQMESILGKGKSTAKSYETPSENQTIEAEHITCSKCEALVALIVYAPDATTEAALEDYTSIMFSKIRELNVPTSVLGKEQDVIVDNQCLAQFPSLKIWPEREPVWFILGTEMDNILEPLVENHCK